MLDINVTEKSRKMKMDMVNLMTFFIEREKGIDLQNNKYMRKLTNQRKDISYIKLEQIYHTLKKMNYSA